MTGEDHNFEEKSKIKRQRLINDRGTFNVIHLNKKFKINDFYTFFIELKWWQFFGFVISGYVALNILFGAIYMTIGIEEITFSKGNFFDDFLNSFFFSTQTLTAVGYGHIAPKGLASNLIASLESMTGLLYFAIITGLLYGRFSKPRADIIFSDNLILRKYKGGRALMFRLMNNRKTMMIKPKIEAVLSTSKQDDGSNDELNEYNRKFDQITLETDQIMYLPTTWTVVHQIDKQSPLHKYTNDEIATLLDAELFLLVEYHEESFGQQVYQVYSYDFSKLDLNVQYVSPFYIDEQGYSVLDHKKLSEVTPI